VAAVCHKMLEPRRRTYQPHPHGEIIEAYFGIVVSLDEFYREMVDPLH
jgi:hypothetical protein